MSSYFLEQTVHLGAGVMFKAECARAEYCGYGWIIEIWCQIHCLYAIGSCSVLNIPQVGVGFRECSLYLHFELLVLFVVEKHNT